MAMSKYRQVQVSFWQDAFVLDLTPEEKYFYVYLMTNSKANQIGIYELHKKVVEMETGYNRETIEKLIARFEEYGKVEYSSQTNELFLKNWVKYNWNNSPHVVKRVEEELEKVKEISFIKKYAETVEALKSEGVSIQYPDCISSLYKQEIRDKEKDKEKEKEKKKESSRPNFSSFDTSMAELLFQKIRTNNPFDSGVIRVK